MNQEPTKKRHPRKAPPANAGRRSLDPTEQKCADPDRPELERDPLLLLRLSLTEAQVYSLLDVRLAKEITRWVPTLSFRHLLDLLRATAAGQPFVESLWAWASAFDELATRLEAAEATNDPAFATDLSRNREVRSLLRSHSQAYLRAALASDRLKSAVAKEIIRRRPIFSSRQLLELWI